MTPTGQPVQGVLVILEGTERRAESDQGGRFELRGVPTATYRILARRVGYAPSVTELTLTREAGTSLELVLTPRAVRLGELTVIGSAEDLAEVREQIRLIPGSVKLIEPEELRRTRQANFKDVLRFVPGVL